MKKVFWRKFNKSQNNQMRQDLLEQYLMNLNIMEVERNSIKLKIKQKNKKVKGKH